MQNVVNWSTRQLVMGNKMGHFRKQSRRNELSRFETDTLTPSPPPTPTHTLTPLPLQFAAYDPVYTISLHDFVTSKLEACAVVHGPSGYHALMQVPLHHPLCRSPWKSIFSTTECGRSGERTAGTLFASGTITLYFGPRYSLTSLFCIYTFSQCLLLCACVLHSHVRLVWTSTCEL